MPVLPFASDADVAKFAKAFLAEHVKRFRKDIAICLTRDAKNSHAYFPALITCIAFALERPLCRQIGRPRTTRTKGLRLQFHGYDHLRFRSPGYSL